MTKGFASMILDQAICCLADLGFFSTALQVAKPPHTGKILRASTFSKRSSKGSRLLLLRLYGTPGWAIFSAVAS